MSNPLQTITILCMFESILLGLVLFLTFFGFPGWLRIATAKLQGKRYVLGLSKDAILSFEGANEVEGTYRTDKGTYELEPEDSYSFNGTKGAIWYKPYNQAVSARIMPLLRDIREMGIESYGELMFLYSTPLEQIRDKLGDSVAAIAEKIQAHDGKILQDLEVIRITDLKNYLESRSPAAENAVIEREVDIVRRKMRNPLGNTNVLLFILMAGLLGLAFGYMMAGAGGGGGEPSTAVAGMQAAAAPLTQLK
ncbi:hypothetical protein FTO70_03865 [Methanosarcina sp. KYL-1]|uniref:hypothetical protein n=1 Tax=Methanosarcina sp. KYL-1 TaxID=2602068 RepID=UPI0021011460|nr:hypothetical protein [Methanosarcina sp. KYL-1]MCQ1534840.1 hypothetical protein [Methanosarcina sp. KYL-1]